MDGEAPDAPGQGEPENLARELAKVKEELAHIRKKLDGVTEMARLAYWEHDIVNDIFLFNDQFFRIYRTSVQQVGGYSMTSEEYTRRFIHPEDLPSIRSEMKKTFASGYSRPDRQIEHRILFPDGTVGHVAVSFFLVTDSGGRPSMAYGVTQDITERKFAELSTREEVNLRRLLVDRSKDGIVILDPDGIVVEANRQFADMLGYPVEEIQNLHVSDWEELHSKEELLGLVRSIENAGLHFTTRHRRKNGTTFDVEISASTAEYHGRKLVFAIHRDITDRTVAERERLTNLHHFKSMDKVNRAIQAADTLERMMSDVLDDVLALFTCDRAFLFYPCDPDATEWTVPMERTRPEYPGAFASGMPVAWNDEMARFIRAILNTGSVLTQGPGGDSPMIDSGNDIYQVKNSLAMPLYPKTGKPWLFGIHQCSHPRAWTPDEKKLFEEIGRRLADGLTSLLMYRDLRKSEEFLNTILSNIPDAIVVKDAKELRFLSVNNATEKLLGFSKEDLLGKTTFDLAPEEQARQYVESDRAVLEGGIPVNIPEEHIRNKKGEPRILHTQKIPIPDDTGKPKFLLFISEDITDFKKLQGRLNQAQKMEALGAMSGGIAHDFNNILQPMLGYCEFLKEDLPADIPQQDFVDGIYRSGLRAKDLVNQILAFSRQSERQMIPVELPAILVEVLKLCRSTIPSTIEIISEIQQDCPRIMADPTQIHQIIMNLMVNAQHAIEQTGGTISVHLKELQLEELDLKSTPLQPGKYAKLSISDTGCGMDPAILDKIFEPYFTTKAQGKGTGLGLAVVYGIIQEHGGHISVYSEVEKGSTFNIFLPLVDDPATKSFSKHEHLYRSIGNEHILVVDDEELIIELESRLLTRLGYHVTTCRNGIEALAVFKEKPDDFDLVITDLNMPNMTGDQLARRIISIRPDTPIIICTGFSEKISHDDSKAIGVKEFVMKPVTTSEMSEKVRKVLDNSLPDISQDLENG